jgi:hypothetical protein
MYTKEQIDCNLPRKRADEEGQWMILDSDGNQICMVKYEGEADTLLSHLNRDTSIPVVWVDISNTA